MLAQNEKAVQLVCISIELLDIQSYNMYLKGCPSKTSTELF